MDRLPPGAGVRRRGALAAALAAAPDPAAQVVRATLRRLGYRFRPGPADLPGPPDLVLARLRTVVFVVDCDRYPHSGCPHASAAGGEGSGSGDNRMLTAACDALGRLGWEAVVIQACEAEDPVALGYRLDVALQGRLIAADGPPRRAPRVRGLS